MDVKEATKAYEAWLRSSIPLITEDLERKHQRMAQSPFSFLRATFYRWIQLWQQVCPELGQASEVLSVGDLHVENFGVWRDAEARLVWGVNDFDETERMPYTNDLVRLAASATLAISENHLSCTPAEACDAILRGYREAIDNGGTPFVLAEQHRWLRDLATNDERDPALYWQKFNELATVKVVPPEAGTALKAALPEGHLKFRVVHRQAGLGSLGRRRYAALAQWRGGWIAREVKELTVSAWHWQQGDPGKMPILYQKAVDQVLRFRDPFIALSGRWLIRRLAPDCSRIELGSLPKSKNELKLLFAMGQETANVHLGSKAAVRALHKDLRQRPAKWLRRAAEAMTKATLDDWKKWARFSRDEPGSGRR